MKHISISLDIKYIFRYIIQVKPKYDIHHIYIQNEYNEIIFYNSYRINKLISIFDKSNDKSFIYVYKFYKAKALKFKFK